MSVATALGMFILKYYTVILEKVSDCFDYHKMVPFFNILFWTLVNGWLCIFQFFTLLLHAILFIIIIYKIFTYFFAKTKTGPSRKSIANEQDTLFTNYLENLKKNNADIDAIIKKNAFLNPNEDFPINQLVEYQEEEEEYNSREENINVSSASALKSKQASTASPASPVSPVYMVSPLKSKPLTSKPTIVKQISEEEFMAWAPSSKKTAAATQKKRSAEPRIKRSEGEAAAASTRVKKMENKML